MDIIDNYLNEVGRYIPAEARRDILTELRDALEEEVADRADAEGVLPDETHALAVLERFGHPLKVASEYQPVRYLIGPDLYPVFMQTLRVLLTVLVAGLIAIGLPLAVTQGWQLGTWSLLDTAISLVFWVFVVTTGVFIAVEYSGEKLGWYESWRPSQLASGSLGVISRGDVMTNLVTEGVFLLWWNNILVVGTTPDNGGEAFMFGLAPIWQEYFWPFNVLVGACFLLHLYVLAKGVWQRPTLVLEIASSTAIVALLVVLIAGPDLLVLSTQASEFLATLANRTIKIALLVICGFCFWDMWTAWQHFRGSQWARS